MPSIKKQEIKIPKEILEELNKLPDKNIFPFEEWQDEVILKYMPIKGCMAISKLLKIGRARIYKRYNDLKSKNNKESII